MFPILRAIPAFVSLFHRRSPLAVTAAKVPALAAFLVLAALTLSAPAAGASGWTSIGPGAGWFSSVVGAPGNPDTVYATGISGAVWTSADGGDTWTFASEFPPAQTATIAAVDPVASATVYAEVNGAIDKSTDGGLTWTQILPNQQSVHGLVVAPSAPATLYAVQTGGGLPAVLRSTDGGATWTLRGTLPSSGFSAATLAVSPTAVNTVYALGAAGFVRSTDGGATWGAPFSPFAPPAIPLGVFVGPGAELYIVASGNTDGSTAVYRSTNSGTTWAADTHGLGAPLTSFAIGAEGDLYASVAAAGGAGANGTLVFHAADGGGAWQQVSSLAAPAALGVDAGQPDRIFAFAQDGGIQRSVDQGRTWKLPSRPPSAVNVADLQAGSQNDAPLYILGNLFATSNVVWHGPESGTAWTGVPIVTGQSLRHLVADGLAGTVYAYGAPASDAIPFISQDGGDSWNPFSAAFFTSQPAFGLSGDLDLPGKLVAMGCTTYSDIESQLVCNQPQIHLTNTFGRGWRLLGSAPGTVSSTTPPYFVRLDPANPTRAYMAFDSSLYRTVPGSLDLGLVPLAGPFVDLAVVPTGAVNAGTPPILYAALGRQRQRVLFKSTDGGTTWAAASAGLPRNLVVDALLVDPIAATTLYLLATDNLGNSQIYVSDDAAATWQPLTTSGLPTDVTSIAATSPRSLFAGTARAGVFALSRP